MTLKTQKIWKKSDFFAEKFWENIILTYYNLFSKIFS